VTPLADTLRQRLAALDDDESERTVFVPNPQVRHPSRWCPRCATWVERAGIGVVEELCRECSTQAE
jgi:hypothetical protein